MLIYQKNINVRGNEMKQGLNVILVMLLVFSGCRSVKTQSENGRLPAPQGTGEIIVEIRGMSKPKGQIMMILVPENPDGKTVFPGDKAKPIVSMVVPAGKKITRVVLREIPYGRYAIAVVHDSNVNGKMDYYAPVLWPEEGFGFSNHKHPLGPPGFEKAAFVLDQPSMKQEINVSYFWRRYGYLPTLFFSLLPFAL